jgi:hypothetical protein
VGEKTKKAYVSGEAFAELVESARQALAYERGARAGYRVTRVAVSRPPLSSKRIARLCKPIKSS